MRARLAVVTDGELVRWIGSMASVESNQQAERAGPCQAISGGEGGSLHLTLDRSWHSCSPIGSTTTGNISLMQRDGRPGTHFCPRRTAYHRLNTRFVEWMIIHPPCSVRVLYHVTIVQRRTDTILILREHSGFQQANTQEAMAPLHLEDLHAFLRDMSCCSKAN